jgi:uncharacterized protein (UPF0261 family)
MYFRDALLAEGLDVTVIDVGLPDSTGDARGAQVTAATIANRAPRAEIVPPSRARALEMMAGGAGEVLNEMNSAGAIDGVVGLGGGSGTALISEAMRALPLGPPKLIVSTVASGDTRPFISTSDITLVPSIADIAGLNRITRDVFRKSAAMAAALIRHRRNPSTEIASGGLVGASMFGVTTGCVDAARHQLEGEGFEVLVFHATGVGGSQLEALAAQGAIDSVLDVTTTELADELVGGIFSAGSTRLTGAGKSGIPQVVSVGALDIVNFGGLDTVPYEYRNRRLHTHTSAVTLMRTTADECAELGRMMAKRLNEATGPVSVFVPLRGFSALSVRGQPFHDPVADSALTSALQSHLAESVDLHLLDLEINDPQFAAAMVHRLTHLSKKEKSYG